MVYGVSVRRKEAASCGVFGCLFRAVAGHGIEVEIEQGLIVNLNGNVLRGHVTPFVGFVFGVRVFLQRMANSGAIADDAHRAFTKGEQRRVDHIGNG